MQSAKCKMANEIPPGAANPASHFSFCILHFAFCISLAALACLVATLAGCAAQSLSAGRLDTHETRPGRQLIGPTTAGDRPDWRNSIAASQPDAPLTRSATDDLARAVEQIGRLDYISASRTLSHLEGRLILANDLDRAAEAAFWAAFCDEKLGLLDQAATGYGRVIERYPASPQARTAAARLNRIRPPKVRVVPPS